MNPYSEYEYEVWCRRRTEAAGGDPDGPLYFHIWRRDRGVFESELREAERQTRPVSDLMAVFG